MQLSTTPSTWLLIALLGVIAISDLADATAPRFQVQQRDDSERVQEAVKMIQGLRQRGLFDIADRYARQQIDSEVIMRGGKSTILLEQMRTLVTHAIAVPREQRPAKWNAADQIAVDFLDADPNHPRKILIDVQIALNHLAQGSLIQQEMSAEILPPSANQSALQQFRVATRRFQQVERDIDRILPEQRNRTLTQLDLTPMELVNLKNNVRYQLAVVNLARAKLYDASQRLNQVDALNQVLSRLDEVLQQSNDDFPLWWKAQTSRGKTYRLMGNYGRAEQLFAGLPERTLTPDLLAEQLTEKILLATDSGDLRRGPKLLAAASDFPQPPAPLQLAVLRLMMAVASASKDPAGKQQLLDQAARWASTIETDHGPYWGRRADIVLVGSVAEPGTDANLGGGELQILIRQGDAAFRKENYRDALKAYTKAVNASLAANDPSQVLALTVRLAQCHEREHNYSTAALLLTDIATNQPKQEAAPNVHLRGCWNWAQCVERAEKSEQEGPTTRFLDALNTHLKRWPTAETANQARLWMGNYHQTQSQWATAADSYLAIASTSPHHVNATNCLARCTDRLIADGRADPSSNARSVLNGLADRLIADLASHDPQQNWTGSQRQRLIVLLKLNLQLKKLSVDQAVQWLEAGIDDVGDDDPDWKALAKAWKIAMIMQMSGSDSDLESLIKELPNRADLMQICLDGLRQGPTKNATTTAVLKDLIASKALQDQLSSLQKQAWQTEKSLAELETGGARAAIDRLSKLAREQPQSLSIQLNYARALSKSGDDLETATAQWRRLAAKVKPRSEAWFEAKYQIASLLKKQDKSNDAYKMLEYLKAIPPGWDQSPWKDRLEQLLREVQP